MMRSVVALFALLLVSSVASAAPQGWEPDAASVSAAEASGRGFRAGPPSLWETVFEAGGPGGQPPRNAHGPPEGGGLPESDEPAFHLHALGDANGDGRPDLLLESQREFITLTAVSGAGFGTIWEIDLDPKESWWMLGDLSGDGVEDLVVHKSRSDSSSTSVPPNPAVSAGEWVTTNTRTYRIVSGSDGKEMFTKSCAETMEYRHASVSGAVGFGGASSYTWTRCYLVEAFGTSSRAVDIVRRESSDREGYSYSLAAFGAIEASSDSIAVQRFDAKGALLWSAQIGDPVRSSQILDIDDFNGDGVPDYAVVAALDGRAYAYAGPVGEFYWLTLASRMAVYNGKDGAKLWEAAVGRPEQEAYLTSADLDGKGRDVFVHDFNVLAPGPAETTVVRLDGATGAEVGRNVARGEFALLLEGGDANKDAKNDLLMFRIKGTVEVGGAIRTDREGTVGAVDASLKALWPPLKVVVEDDYVDGGLASPDFNGDGVPEVTLFRSNRDSWKAFVYDGATGSALWTFQAPEDGVGGGPVADLDGVPGMDLAMVTWDLPADKAQPEDGIAYPGVSPEEEIDVLAYPGYLEVRRGTDLALVWRKQIHDPAQEPKAHSSSIEAEPFVVPDLNGNKVNEIVVNLEEGFSWPMVFLAGFEGMGPSFGRAIVLDGSDGAPVATYPKDLAQKPSELGTAAPLGFMPPKPAGDSPQLGLAWLVLAVGLVVWSRRRYA